MDKITALGLCVYILCLVLDYSTGCSFPAFVQSNNTMRDWKSKIRGQGAEVSLSLQFDGERLNAEATDSRAKSYTRVCIQVYHGDRYLVAHEEKGQRDGKYTCMQFVKRGTGVLQIKEAEVSGRMNRNLCDDSRLVLQEWLIVDMNSAPQQREVCSLRGGWNIIQFDKGTMKAVCDGYEGEARMESECLAGDSLTFYFRRQGCVSEEMYMYSTQKTFCLANWREGRWNFILLKHHTRKYMWVMRYPLKVKDRFTSYIFRDIFAPLSLDSNTRNYVHVTMSRQPESQGMPLCYDDYDVCSVMGNPCTYNEKMAVTCSKTCNVCNTTVPSVTSLGHHIEGLWADGALPERTAMIVRAASVSFGTTEIMKHVSWGPRSGLSPNPVNGIREVMFVSRTEQGCRPRYSCARIAQVSPAVMFLQISKFQFWPLIDDPKKKVDCSGFTYDADHSNRYRSKGVRLLVSKSVNSTVECDMSAFERFDVEFGDGVRCSGYISQPRSKDSLNFTMPGCEQGRLTQSFSCIEYARYPPSNDLIMVTRSVTDEEQIHCWIFPKRPTNIFYLLPASQCNEQSKRRIRKDRLVPIGTFTRHRGRVPVHTKSTVVENTVELEHIANNNTVQISYQEDEEIRTSVRAANASDGTKEAGTGNVTQSQEDGGKPNPLVITALVITMVAIQLTLLCTCKC